MGRPRKRSEPIVTAATRWLGIPPCPAPLAQTSGAASFRNAQREAGGTQKLQASQHTWRQHRREPDLTGEAHWRCSQAILYGTTEKVLVITHGFDRDMIACFVDECFATAEREVVTGPGRAVTDAGRQALKD
jgi:hypothetical protein